ncbi:MAG TPA: TIGR00269 family protein [Nitrosopumilaceae archaeon]|nr:TIGR00269 family protein [Nitrosopumilaceae archaeon]
MNCNRCGNIAVYSRKYSGESLCSLCFSDSIVKKTAKTISKYNMIQEGDVVGVAVSGGKDSLSLLHVLKKMSQSHNFKLIAITVDEGIPNYRDEALEIVRNFCNIHGVEHRSYAYKELFDLTLEESLDLRENEKTTSCSICGILRRRAIDFGAKDLDVDVIATGHNLDDVLQTFIINVLSGDTNKIGWMEPITSNKIRKIKPFCEIYENEIVFYSFTNQIPFQSEQCPHMNEGIRTEIREFLNSLENHHSGIKNSMYGSVMRLVPIVKNANYKQRRVCQKCGNQCTGEVCSVCTMLVNLKQDQS